MVVVSPQLTGDTPPPSRMDTRRLPLQVRDRRYAGAATGHGPPRSLLWPAWQLKGRSIGEEHKWLKRLVRT